MESKGGEIAVRVNVLIVRKQLEGKELKISRVDTKIVAVPFQEMPSASKLRMGTPYTIELVKIETDDGFTELAKLHLLWTHRPPST